jgi:hypothetical protein
MIPLLAIIISIYCCLRLLEMGLAAYGRQSKEFTDVSWLLYFGGAVVIAILCFVIIIKALEAERQMRLDAAGAEIDRKYAADVKKFHDDLDALTTDTFKRLDAYSANMSKQLDAKAADALKQVGLTQ